MGSQLPKYPTGTVWEAGSSVDQANENGATPLLIASENGHVEVVRVLVEAGASVDQADKDGATPLSRASANGHDEVVRELASQ